MAIWFAASWPTFELVAQAPSPYGIQVDSPLQRQWISYASIGSIRRIASIVCGAAGSQRALKWRSPTTIWSRAIRGG